MEMISGFGELLKKAIAVLFIGGFGSYILGLLFGQLATVPLWGSISLLIGVVLALLLAKKGNVDDYNLFDFVILLGVVGFMGGIVTALLPMASPFILSVGAFTVTGLVWTFVYILLAELVIGYF
jgi:hypothetical protein